MMAHDAAKIETTTMKARLSPSVGQHIGPDAVSTRPVISVAGMPF